MDKRKFLDAALTILFLLVMSFYFLPRIWHEILGLTMFLAAAVHVFINRRRFFSMFKGKQTAKKIFSIAIDVLLLVGFITIFVTGIFMSNYLFHDFISMELRRNMTVHQFHVSLPYTFMILIGLHIGLHWRELREKFLRSVKNTLAEKILAAAVIFFGAYGFFLNRVGDRILMKHIFATPATDFSLPIFLFLMFSTIGLYTAVVIILEKIFEKAKKK